MKLACVFTGQGSQSEKLGVTLQSFPEFESQLHDFQNECDLPLKRWLFEDSQETLNATEIQQPLIYFYGYVAFRGFLSQISIQRPIQGAYYAGHSLGEYTALAALGVLDPKWTLRAVRIRGQKMQHVCPIGQGAMAAIMTSSVTQVRKACEQISLEYGEPGALEIANYNSKRQVVVSGKTECVDMIERLSAEFGTQFGILKVVRLQVSAPFHSKYMSPMKDDFYDSCLQELCLQPAQDEAGVWIPNVTAQPVIANELDAKTIQSLLLSQLDRPVQWESTTALFAADPNLTAIIEFGPKPILSSLMKRDVSCPIFFVGSWSDVNTVAQHLSHI